MRLRVFSAFFALMLLCTLSADAQNSPEPVPGVHIPSGSTPWAVDVYDGKQEIVPIHSTSIQLNNHRGANVAGSLAGSFFYKPKMTEEVSGTHARISLHTDKPVFYIYLPSDPKRDSSSDIFASWAVSRATIKKDHRVFAQVRFTQLTGNAKRNDSEVDVSTEMLPDGWVRITPKAPLTPGNMLSSRYRRPKMCSQRSSSISASTPRPPILRRQCPRTDPNGRYTVTDSLYSPHTLRSTSAISPTVA